MLELIVSIFGRLGESMGRGMLAGPLLMDCGGIAAVKYAEDAGIRVALASVALVSFPVTTTMRSEMSLSVHIMVLQHIS